MVRLREHSIVRLHEKYSPGAGATAAGGDAGKTDQREAIASARPPYWASVYKR